MKRSLQEYVELVVFGLVALLVGTGLLWLVGWLLSIGGVALKWIAGLLWNLLRFIVPVAIAGGLVYFLVKAAQDRQSRPATATTDGQPSAAPAGSGGAGVPAGSGPMASAGTSAPAGTTAASPDPLVDAAPPADPAAPDVTRTVDSGGEVSRTMPEAGPDPSSRPMPDVPDAAGQEADEEDDRA